MTKDKVGAEPKEKRIKHYYDKAEAFHIGVSRDEWCCYRAKRYPFVAIGGYFIDFGDWWAKKCSTELLEKYWDKDAFGTSGYKHHVFGVVDRKRKIAVIKYDCRYRWHLEEALPDDFTIYYVMSFPIFNIAAPRNRKTLLKEYAKYLIYQYMLGCYQEFKVLNARTKHLYEDSTDSENKKDIISKLKELSNKVPTKTSLFDKDAVFEHYTNGKVKYPTIDDIVNDKVFTDKQKEYFAKCRFYTKYIYDKATIYNWKDVDNNWNKIVDSEVTWQSKIENETKERHEKVLKQFKDCRKRVKEYLDELKREILKADGINNLVNYWRTKNNIYSHYVEYKDCRLLPNDTIEWFKTGYNVNCISFDNVQLKLKGDSVVTSKGATVPLNPAIKLFNSLYINHLINKDVDNVVFTNNINICCYKLRYIRYKEKVTDDGRPLGYKEWLIQIGCHSLWFDDIKDFARYYNLQDKLNFPLDKTTQECRDNHLLHSCSKKTIDTVETLVNLIE